MNLLAIEASTETLSLAVQRGSDRYAQQAPGGAAASRGVVNHVLALLAQAGLAPTHLDGIVFGQGPGAFTGLRIACSVAQGLAYPTQIKVLAVCGLMAIAHSARQSGCGDQIVACLDARMEQVYVAHYQWALDHWICTVPPAVMAPDKVTVPPGWAVAGNAYAVYPNQWQDGPAHHFALPNATAMLDLAPWMWQDGQAIDARLAMPLYVRDRVALNTQERLAGERL